MKTLHLQLIKTEGLEDIKDVIRQVAAQKSVKNKLCNPIVLNYTVFDTGIQ
ncbi:hypothetical protein [Myroides odoratus]|uniref:hypothetical protein n=1 Tax=Myroides odoratus TaxID=256 RepID=UPI00333F30AD